MTIYPFRIAEIISKSDTRKGFFRRIKLLVQIGRFKWIVLSHVFSIDVRVIWKSNESYNIEGYDLFTAQGVITVPNSSFSEEWANEFAPSPEEMLQMLKNIWKEYRKEDYASPEN